MTIGLFCETHDKKCGPVCVDGGGGKLILNYEAKNRKGMIHFLGHVSKLDCMTYFVKAVLLDGNKGFLNSCHPITLGNNAAKIPR